MSSRRRRRAPSAASSLLAHGASGNFADPHVALSRASGRMRGFGSSRSTDPATATATGSPAAPPPRRGGRPPGSVEALQALGVARGDRRRAFALGRDGARDGAGGARVHARPGAARAGQPSLARRRLLVLHGGRAAGPRRAVPLAGRAAGGAGEDARRGARECSRPTPSRRLRRAARGCRCCSGPGSSSPTPRISSRSAARRRRCRRATARSPRRRRSSWAPRTRSSASTSMRAPARAKFPDATLALLPGIGHSPHFAAPDEVVEAILEVERRASRSGAASRQMAAAEE